MTERSRNIMVGLTTIAGLVSLSILLLLFGYIPSFISPGYTLHAHLSDSQGVNDSTRVWLYGIDVGKVQQVKLATFPKRGVDLVLRINEDVKVPEGTLVNINAPLLGGTSSVTLDTALASTEKGKIKFLPTDGTGELKSPQNASSLQAGIAKQLQDSLTSATTSIQAQLKTRMDKYQVTIDKIDALAQNLNQLTAPLTPQQVDEGKAQGNASSVVARLDERVKEFHKSIEAINKWVQDDKLREDVRTTAANARKLTEKADATLDQVNKATAEANQQIAKVSTRFIAAADGLAVTISSMNKTLQDIHNGKGTAGKLINDPALYDNLNDAAQRIGKAADEVKMLLEKWRKEGIPVHF